MASARQMLRHIPTTGVPLGAGQAKLGDRAGDPGYVFCQRSKGACLLDRDDPTKVLGRVVQPIVRPRAKQRYGYVPNVA